MTATIIVVIVIALAVGLSIRSMVRSSKSSSCGACPYGSECSKYKNDKDGGSCCTHNGV